MEKRFLYRGLGFPVLPTLCYQADGPDKLRPDRLFIQRWDGAFSIYFEAGYDTMDLPEPPGYDTMVVERGDRQLVLRYPAEKPGVTVGYFRVFRDGAPMCCGDLRIEGDFLEGLRQHEELGVLFGDTLPEASREF